MVLESFICIETYIGQFHLCIREGGRRTKDPRETKSPTEDHICGPKNRRSRLVCNQQQSRLRDRNYYWSKSKPTTTKKWISLHLQQKKKQVAFLYGCVKPWLSFHQHKIEKTSRIPTWMRKSLDILAPMTKEGAGRIPIWMRKTLTCLSPTANRKTKSHYYMDA